MKAQLEEKLVAKYGHKGHTNILDNQNLLSDTEKDMQQYGNKYFDAAKFD